MKNKVAILALAVATGCSSTSSEAFDIKKLFTYNPSTDNWNISCGVDPGAIKKEGDTWIFKTSKNKCYKKGTKKITGTFHQRAEIATHDDKLPANEDGKYKFETLFTFKDNEFFWNNKFDIFQIHDGRDGCAPPLKVGFTKDSRLYIRADYKTGPGESCIRRSMYNLGSSKILRNGTEYKLKIIIDFDGKSGFDIEVYLNNKLEIQDRYVPPTTGFKSRHWFFKHGVYSRDIFNYELKSKFTLEQIN